MATAPGTSPHDQFWAEYFGVSDADLTRPGVSVTSHVGLGDYRGVWFFTRGQRMIISAPHAWVPVLRQRFGGGEAKAELPSEREAREIFGADFDTFIGPVFLGSLDKGHFRPMPSDEVQPITAADIPAIETFSWECGEAEWGGSGVDEAPLYQVGYFENDAIVAMAGFRPWGQKAGDPCGLTHPAHRGRKVGSAVVSATIDLALADGKLLLYQTLESNTPAVKLAKRLGYQQYARQVAVRLKSHTPASGSPTAKK